MEPRFIVDVNVGRLARRLRMLGFDTLFINGADDSELVRIAHRENRVLLTRDTGIMQRRIVSTGEVKAVFIESPDIRKQLAQVIAAMGLGPGFDTFTRCLECNEFLVYRRKPEVRELVPPYVFRTRERFMQCPVCGRIYWQGTHWERMSEEVSGLKGLYHP